MNAENEISNQNAPTESPAARGSVRASYYLHAAVMGMLAGVGCSTCFGPIGGIVAAVALGGWGVIAAIKMYEAPNEKADLPTPGE